MEEGEDQPEARKGAGGQPEVREPPVNPVAAGVAEPGPADAGNPEGAGAAVPGDTEGEGAGRINPEAAEGTRGAPAGAGYAEGAVAANRGAVEGAQTLPAGAGDADHRQARPVDPEVAEKYRKFKKVDGATYDRVNAFLRKRTYVTAREWAIARLCADFKTTGGSEMTFIGEHLPELVPFMKETYTPQAVNQARSAFKRKVKKAGATFFYGAMCGFFTAEELDDILFEASEVARFLLEVEGTTLEIDEEISAEDRITDVMRTVAESAARILKARMEEEGGEG